MATGNPPVGVVPWVDRSISGSTIIGAMPRKDAQLHVAIAQQVGGGEQERRPGHGMASASGAGAGGIAAEPRRPVLLGRLEIVSPIVCKPAA